MGLLPQNPAALMMGGNNPAALAMLGQQQAAALYATDNMAAVQNVSAQYSVYQHSS